NNCVGQDFAAGTFVVEPPLGHLYIGHIAAAEPSRVTEQPAEIFFGLDGVFHRGNCNAAGIERARESRLRGQSRGVQRGYSYSQPSFSPFVMILSRPRRSGSDS